MDRVGCGHKDCGFGERVERGAITLLRSCCLVGQEGWSALLMAADKELTTMVSLLLESGADVNAQTRVCPVSHTAPPPCPPCPPLCLPCTPLP
jgi:hypothetical protein